MIIRARLRAYHAATHTADLEPISAPEALMDSVPCLQSIPPTDLVAGNTAIVLLWGDVGGIVLGAYGGTPTRTFAAPTSSVKLAAVEGTATTMLRSDTTLALDVSIAPTWTGAHIFKKTADSATGWQVQDQDGNIILDVDSVNNRVGVGTATPAAPLEIYKAYGAAIGEFLRIHSDSNADGSGMQINFYHDTVNSNRVETYRNPTTDSKELALYATGTAPNHNTLYEYLRLGSDQVMFNRGNVGIGITPTHLLTLGAASAINEARLTMQRFTAGGDPTLMDFGVFVSAGPGRYGTIQVLDLYASRNLILQPDGGNVGIGDVAPGEKLDVTGNTNVTGVYKVDDIQVVSNRVIDSRCDDTINSGDATTDGVIDALRDAMITHGLIAPA